MYDRHEKMEDKLVLRSPSKSVDTGSPEEWFDADSNMDLTKIQPNFPTSGSFTADSGQASACHILPPTQLMVGFI